LGVVLDAAGDAHGFGFKPLKPFRKVTRPALKVAKSLGAGTKKRGRKPKGSVLVATSRTKGSEAAKQRMAAVRAHKKSHQMTAGALHPSGY
jgi:hypothetical protein